MRNLCALHRRYWLLIRRLSSRTANAQLQTRRTFRAVVIKRNAAVRNDGGVGILEIWIIA